MSGERTEKATPKRRQDERRKGNIFQSREIVIVATLLVSFYALKALGPHILKTLSRKTSEILSLAGDLDIITFSDARRLFIDIFVLFAISVLPLLMLTGLIAIIVTMAQTKLLVKVEPLGFKMSRLSPLQGIKKMFSLKSVIEILKSILKIVIISYIIYKTLFDEVMLLPRLMNMPVENAISYTSRLIMNLVTTTAIAFVVIAALDYLYQWWDYERNIKMTKQEIKEEYKETEGDPQIKGAIRSRQQNMARSRMMQNVPKADVVIRNPTHYAVAIKYNPDEDNAPLVLAKGAGYLALRIIEEAEANGVVVTENRTLARGLYEAVDIDQEIPAEFYHAVAEVLVFVFRLREKVKS